MQERETAINPLDWSLTPETGLQASASHSSVAHDRSLPLRILWWRLRRLLIAWLIHATCEGQSETPGRGGVPCENLWGSTAHRPPCLWLPPVWLYSAMWGTAHQLGHHKIHIKTQVKHNFLCLFSFETQRLSVYDTNVFTLPEPVNKVKALQRFTF